MILIIICHMSCNSTLSSKRAQITPDDLLPLALYRLLRKTHQACLIPYRQARSLAVGSWMRLQFEDAVTLRYQIQEVLHAERNTSAEALQQEIDTYAHLLPEGDTWKATLLIEVPDAAQRARELPQLNAAARQIYLDVPGHERLYAQVNRDQPDGHLQRLSGVHFLYFALGTQRRAAVLAHAPVTLGCAHAQYEWCEPLPIGLRTCLHQDLHHSLLPPPWPTSPSSSWLTQRLLPCP